VTQEFAAKIGADGFAPDASRAVTLAQSLLEK
jgi:methanogenic corrinoid protein MtbC1